MEKDFMGFKPCYKWITFNTKEILGVAQLTLRF